MKVESVTDSESGDEIIYPIKTQSAYEYHFHYNSPEGWKHLKSSWSKIVVSSTTRLVLKQLGIEYRVVNAKTAEVITHSNFLINNKIHQHNEDNY